MEPNGLASVALRARWFNVLDLANAFFAIPVHQEHWYKSAAMIKVKVNHKTKSLESSLNNQADIVAKEGARVGPRWVMPDTEKLGPVSKVTPPMPNAVDWLAVSGFGIKEISANW